MNEPPNSRQIEMREPITVNALSEAMGLKPYILVRDLMEIGVFASILSQIDAEAAATIGRKHGYIIKIIGGASDHDD